MKELQEKWKFFMTFAIRRPNPLPLMALFPSIFFFCNGIFSVSVKNVSFIKSSHMEFVKKNLCRIFRLKILHRQFHIISTVLVVKNTKNE